MKNEENATKNKIALNDFSSYHFFNDTSEVNENGENSIDSQDEEDQSPNSLLPSNQTHKDFQDPSLFKFDFLNDEPSDKPNKTIPNRGSIGSFSTFSSINHNSMQNSSSMFKQFPNYYSSQTQYLGKNQFHNSMPFKQQNPYSPYQMNHNFPKYQSNFELTNFGNYSHSFPFNYNPNINSHTIINNFIYTTPNINEKGSHGIKVEKTKKKTKSNEEEYNTLEELLSSLKGGKQIGNYIKSRGNTETMINLIKKLPSDKIGELIEMIKPKLKDIMISNNKFSQKLFEQCTAEQRLIIVEEIKDDFIDIAMNKWGSYSLQALIKIISLPEEQEIIKKCIEGRIYELAMDKQANFVLQKLILLFNEKGMSLITEEIFNIFNHLIYNSVGIGLLKNLVLTNKSAEMRKRFVSKVNENLSNIINNQTGHTLLLQMMEKWDFETCKPMIVEIYKDIGKYSFMKYSSIVVMRCIEISEPKLIKALSSSILKGDCIYDFVSYESGKLIIKEIFQKLPLKKKNEFYCGIKNNLKSILEKRKI